MDYIGCDIDWKWPLAIHDSYKKLVDAIADVVLRDAVKCELEKIFILRHVIRLLECFLNGQSTECNTYHDYLKFVSEFPPEIPGDRTCLHSDYRGALSTIQDLAKFSDAAAALYKKLLEVSYTGGGFNSAEINISVSDSDRNFREALLELHRYIESSLPYRLLIEALRFFKSHKSYDLDGWTNKRFESIDIGLDEYKALFPPRILWRVGADLGNKLKLIKPQQLHFVDNKTESEKKLFGSGMEPYYTEKRVLLIKQLNFKLKNELVDFDVRFPELVSRVERKLPLARLELERLLEESEMSEGFKRIEDCFPEISKRIGRCKGDLPFYREHKKIIVRKEDEEGKVMALHLRKLRKNEGKNIPWMYFAKLFLYIVNDKGVYKDDTSNFWQKVKYHYDKHSVVKP